jgi:DNA-binding SARP family transcriptional activator
MFRFRTLGGAVLEGKNGPLSGRSSLRLRLAFLALLASSRGRGVARDKLLVYLWPERDTDRGRHSLSQLLHAIRRDLGAEAITFGVDDLRLNPSHVWTDIAAFEQAIADGELEAAVSLYEGPFLDGFFLSNAPEFERWVEEERARLAGAYTGSLEALALAASHRGDHVDAAKLWRRRLAIEPLNSGATLALMRALASAGDRAGAIQQARIHASLLERELGLPPDTAVTTFAQQLFTEKNRAVASRSSEDARGDAETPASRADVERSSMTSSSDASPATAVPTHAPASRNLISGNPRRALHRGLASGHVGRIAAALIIVLVVAAALSQTLKGAFGSARGVPRAVVIGAVSGTDNGLALAVGEALRAELEAAPGLHVVAQARAREAMLLMQRSPETPIADSLASQVAARLGAPLAVTATAEPLGLGAEIVVRLMDSRDGTTISTLAAHPPTSDAIVAAVTRLTEELRERALNIQLPDSSSALPAVTTASIAALRDYALARQSIAHGDNERTLSYAEAAVIEDSTFALAHYLLGDLLWYVDRQHHSDEHLERAFALSSRLRPRERLIVRARYEQLVRDRPDSALQYWKLLQATYPDEARAYEGMAWAYTALGQARLADAAADTAFQLDSTVGSRGVRGHFGRLMASGDTTAAIAYARSSGAGMLFGALYGLAFSRRDWKRIVRLVDSAQTYGVSAGQAGALRQVAFLALGDLANGEKALNEVRADPHVQYLPRALLLQARAEATEGSKKRAAALSREALAWLRQADLSPPAYARLAERIADAAARANDMTTIAAVRHFVVAKDAGRGLRSYALAMPTIGACEAFARGDMRAALALLARTRGQMFYGRAISLTMQLEADALAAWGERQRADSIYRVLADPPPEMLDGDSETFEVVRRAAAQILAAERLPPISRRVAGR